MKKDDENAKDKRWQVPMDLPGVKPEDYKDAVNMASEAAHPPKAQVVKPDDKNNPATEELKKQGKYPKHDEEIGGG